METVKRSHSSSKSNGGKHKSEKAKDPVSKSASSRQKLFEVHTPEQDLTPVCFPVVKQLEISRVLPRFTTVLTRTPEDGVGMEDLDQLQQDLEKLLSTCAVRHRTLRSEVESIDRVEEKKERKGKPHEKSQSVKRKRVDEKPKYKDPRNISRLLKTKHSVPVNFISNLAVRYEIPKIVIPKHDVSDRFWLSVDPYCQEITRDNVCFLDELIKECSQEIDVKIPELGEHYAVEWADHTLQMEQINGHIKAGGKKQANAVTYNNEIKKNGITNSMIENFPSPLTQRLLDTLIEEKVIKQMPSVYDKLKSNDFSIKGNNGARNGMCLDRRLRKELVDQGILDMEDLPKIIKSLTNTHPTPINCHSLSYPQEDEILLEIKKCQHELSTINKQNITELSKLRTVVARDIHKQEVKSALDIADKQVMNMYNKILMAKQTHAAEMAESAFDTHLLPRLNLSDYENEATNIIKQQVLLHRKLTELTDFSLIE